MGYRQGSRTVPIALAKMQVNRSVGLGGHNKNRSGVIAGPVIALDHG
jgi:hypothetical protein